MLSECYLAFPHYRVEYLRHAGLVAEVVFLTAVSEIGKHVWTRRAIQAISMETLLKLLDLVLKKDTCLVQVRISL